MRIPSMFSAQFGRVALYKRTAMRPYKRPRSEAGPFLTELDHNVNDLWISLARQELESIGQRGLRFPLEDQFL
jgi:hypothetical protein